MKRILLVLGAALLFAGTIWASGNIEEPRYERANVQFDEMVKLRDVFLMGQYLFIHDADKMAKGEDCTWIYRADGRFVTSFHCTPVQRPAQNKFKVLISQRSSAYDVPRVLEIQFPGSNEGHHLP
jgi:hypothetical protein